MYVHAQQARGFDLRRASDRGWHSDANARDPSSCGHAHEHAIARHDGVDKDAELVESATKCVHFGDEAHPRCTC